MSLGVLESIDAFHIKASNARDNNVHEKTHQITHRRESRRRIFLGSESNIFKTFFSIFSEMIFILGSMKKEGEEKRWKNSNRKYKIGGRSKHFYLLSEKRNDETRKNLFLSFNKHRSKIYHLGLSNKKMMKI